MENYFNDTACVFRFCFCKSLAVVKIVSKFLCDIFEPLTENLLCNDFQMDCDHKTAISNVIMCVFTASAAFLPRYMV